MSNRKGILLINQTPAFLESIATALRQSGYAVHPAMELREALSVLTENSVSLIVCDSNLSDVSGYDFLYYLKNDPLRKTVPFLFFVPVNDQGRASKAFQLGVVDFLVYPMEVKDFLGRIQEILPTGLSPSSMPAGAAAKASPDRSQVPTAPDSDDRRCFVRKRPLPDLNVELSRDGLLYLPGRIKNFSQGGLFVETSLLGKPGVVLKIRFALPKESVTLQGQIQHVSFDDFQKPAGIGIKMTDTGQWETVFHHLNSLIGHEPDGAQVSAGKASDQMEETVALTAEEMGVLARPPMLAPPVRKAPEVSIETRFYHSLIGKQLDNYKAVSFVGAGKMGGVFKAWDVALEREVALKVISYELSAEEKFRDMFITEARLVSKLDHPNIARIYHIGNTDDILYFSMEFISGGTMAEMIAEHRNMNTLRGLEYLITICRTLDFVSRQNIIHRDIKPANIMVNPKGTLKIVDFGVAQTVSRDNRSGGQDGIVGSPYYIAPEVLSGRPVDHRSDIYSLGACFYHALTGTPPFTGKDTKEVLIKHLNEKLTPVRDKNPKVSNFFAAIIEKMMAKDPDDRYQTYSAIVEDLQDIRSRAVKFHQSSNRTMIFQVKNGKIV